MESILLCLYVVIIIFGFILFFSYLFFHYFFSYKIIILLKQEGFNELSDILNKTILKHGKFPIAGTDNKDFFEIWENIRKLKLSKNMKGLFRLHLIYLIIHIMIKILVFSSIILFLLFLILIIW